VHRKLTSGHGTQFFSFSKNIIHFIIIFLSALGTWQKNNGKEMLLEYFTLVVLIAGL
jgi:hypothetical protein